MSLKFGATMLTVLATIAFPNIRAATIFDNLGARSMSPTSGPFASLVDGTFDRRAQEFDTGGLSYRLDSVTMPLHYKGGDPVHVVATLWDTTTTPPRAPIPGQPNPGRLLGEIGSATFSGAAGASYTKFSGAAQLTLEPNIPYWVALAVDQGNPASMSWDLENVHTSRDYSWIGSGGYYWSAHGNAAGNWSLSSMSIQNYMAIEGTAAVVPEPSAFALGVVGIAVCVAARRKGDR